MNWQCRAVIFDFNGVIVNDEPLHAELMQQILHEEGVRLPTARYRELALGVTDRAGFAALLLAAGHEPNDKLISSFIERKSAAYLKAIASRDLLFPGVKTLLRKLAAHFPLALVSGALRIEIETVLQRDAIQQYFHTIISSEDVSRSKPDPDGFLRALATFNEKAEIQAADCLVIEDSVAGVAAAKRAGMKCLAVTNSYPAEKLAIADWIINDLSEFDFSLHFYDH